MFSLFQDSRYEKDAGNKTNWYFFYLLVVKLFVRMYPLSGKERTRNYRKNASKDKLKKVHENDKWRKRKERQQKNLMTLRELNEKIRKERERHQRQN